MGEIAEMMLDGTLCEQCGEYIGTDNDFPTLCAACAREANFNEQRILKTSHKVQCPHCGDVGHDTYLYKGMEMFACPKAPSDKILAYNRRDPMFIKNTVITSLDQNFEENTEYLALKNWQLLNDFDEWSNYQGE